jgi:DNA-binding transcriptional LysR family regulator
MSSIGCHPERTLKGIVPFVCAADAGGFTAAAVWLNLTSSAVSKSVARLERRLGVVLFERTTRRRVSPQYPDVRPHLLFADRFVDLADEGIDLALRIGGPPDLPSSLTRCLFRSRTACLLRIASLS